MLSLSVKSVSFRLRREATISRASYCLSSLAQPQITQSIAVSPSSSLISPIQAYDELVKQRKIQDDLVQRKALKQFEGLFQHLVEFEQRRPEVEVKLKEINKRKAELLKRENEIKEAHRTKGESWFYGKHRKISLFGSMFDKKVPTSLSPEELREKEYLEKQRKELDLPQGMYIHGGPGSGKTFLMDLFYRTLPQNVLKRRVHFNEFMLEVHRNLHKLNKKGYSGDDMMRKCVEIIAEDTKILCFDEFQVTDIADAMVMKQLFSSLYDAGVTIVITSNREIDELYKNGIQRDLFVPFLNDLKKNYKIVRMQSETDYRTALLDLAHDLESSVSDEDHVDSLFFVDSQIKYEKLWNRMTENSTFAGKKLRVQGRDVTVRQVAMKDDIARFNFLDLCGKPLGPADYQTIARVFHTIFIDDIPQLTLTEVNQIRRFITLIDTFYDQNVVLVASSSKPIDSILALGEVKTEEDAAKIQLQQTDLLGTANYVPAQANVDEVFAFQRTISRLKHMQKPDYLEHAAKKKHSYLNGISPIRFFARIGLSPESKEKLSSEQIAAFWDRYTSFGEGSFSTEDLKRMLQEINLLTAGHEQITKAEVDAIWKKIGNSEKNISLDTFFGYFSSHPISTIL